MNLYKYFVSEAHKCVFALCYLYKDKDARMELLDITEELYEDKEKAKDWYHRIVKIIHSNPDSESDPDTEKAITKLNELYDGMVEE